MRNQLGVNIEMVKRASKIAKTFSRGCGGE